MLDAGNRRYCDGCLPERQAEQAAGWAAAGGSILARLRARGADPAHGGEAGRKWGERNAEHVAAVAAWEWERGGLPTPVPNPGRALLRLKARSGNQAYIFARDEGGTMVPLVRLYTGSEGRGAIAFPTD